MHVTVFVATSLDGYIARPDGALDWLDNLPSDEGEDYGYQALLDSVDVLVMGRNTFDKVLSFGGPWPYGAKPVVVLTTHALHIPEELAGSVEVMSGEPAQIVARLARRGVQRIYLDGGQTIQRFLAAGLVQRLIITRIPVLIGQGVALFGPLAHDIGLRHVRTQSHVSGLVQSEYEVLPLEEP